LVYKTIDKIMEKNWEKYEIVAEFLLQRFKEEFGLSLVEGKQSIGLTSSGTSWEIDCRGVRVDDGGVVIIECRRYTTSKLSQEQIGGLAFRIIDTGASGGIVVSPLGLQAGAEKVAKANNIINVSLNAEANFSEFIMSFIDKIMVSDYLDTSNFKDSIIVTTYNEDGSFGSEFKSP
jgi:hypothetical protein